MRKLILIIILLLSCFDATTGTSRIVGSINPKIIRVITSMERAEAHTLKLHTQRTLLTNTLETNQLAIAFAKGYVAILLVILLVVSTQTVHMERVKWKYTWPSLYSEIAFRITNHQVYMRRTFTTAHKVLILRLMRPLFTVLRMLI